MAEKRATISLQFSGQKPVKLRLYAASAFGCGDPARFRVKEGEAWLRFGGQKVALVDVETAVFHAGKLLRDRLGLPVEAPVEEVRPEFRIGQLVTMRGEHVLEGEGDEAGLESEIFRVMSPPIRDELKEWRIAVGRGPNYAGTCRFVPCRLLKPLRRCAGKSEQR